MFIKTKLYKSLVLKTLFVTFIFCSTNEVYSSKVFDDISDTTKRVNIKYHLETTQDETRLDESKSLIANIEEAEEYYQKAQSYFHGTGCNQSLKEAFSYYLKAANLNHPKAYLTLGMLYEGGVGCKKSLQESLKFYKQAEKNKVEGADKKRARVEKKLNPICIIF